MFKDILDNWLLIGVVLFVALSMTGISPLGIIPGFGNIPIFLPTPQLTITPTPTSYISIITPTVIAVGPTSTPTPTPPPIPSAVLETLKNGFSHTEPSWDPQELFITTRVKSQDSWRISWYLYNQDHVDKTGIIVYFLPSSLWQQCSDRGIACNQYGTLDTGDWQDHVHGAGGASPDQAFAKDEGYIIEVRLNNNGQQQSVYFGKDKEPKLDPDQALQDPFRFQGT